MKNFNHLMCITLICLFSLSSRAEITNVTVSPTVLNVDINSGATTNVVWTVTLSENNAISREGEFLASNSIFTFDTVNQALSVIAPTNTTPQPVRVNESLAISASQAQAWWSSNIRQLNYRRAFSEGAESRGVSAMLTINLVDGTPPPNQTTQRGLRGLRVLSDGLRIDRIELSFLDHSSVLFVEQNSSLKAKLKVNYQGFGILRGYWQVANSAIANGEPQFRNLSLINKQLPATQQTEILSPVLPTNNFGRYYLRFCVTKVGSIQLPQNLNRTCPSETISTVVGYQVLPEKQMTPLIQGIKPDTHFVNKESTFSWPKVPDTQVYQLQILKKKEGNFMQTNNSLTIEELIFVKGMLLPPSINKTVLSNYVIHSLKRDKTYYWRISSYDSEGKLLAQSKLTAIQFN